MTMIGMKIRHFSIVAALGRGGMGDVYAGYDENLKRKVAIKAIQTGRGLTPLARARFLREAQMLSQLDHQGICRIYDYIEFEGGEYLILELIEGRTLTRAAGDLDDRTKLEIARQMAQVLDMAHGEGIVHRDLKPDNVMLTPEDQVKLLDFGLARSLDEDSPDFETDAPAAGQTDDDLGQTIPLNTDTTQPGTVLGTPLFMSPEQARMEPVSPASDMFSFGLVLQWLFTGSYAYENSDNILDLVEQASAASTLPARGIDRDLAALIERLKSRSPARRPNALVTSEKLEWIASKPRRRNRRFIAAAVICVILLAGFKYVTDLRSERQRAESNRAQAEDLMGFMLGDLRDKLEPVGRLDVLDDVGAKALEYYAARREKGLGDEENFKLAKAMMQIGEVRMGQGDLEAAREAFEQAFITSESLAARAPHNTEYLAGLGAVHFWIGNIDYNQGRLDDAEIRFLEYLEIGRRLVRMEPENADWIMEIGYGYTNLGALAEERGDEATALEFIQLSIEVKRDLIARNPADADLKYSLANSLGWAGRMLDQSGAPEESLANLQEARTVLEAIIADDPANTTVQDLLSVTLQLIARGQTNMGRNNEALLSYQADLDIISRLVVHDPDNSDWRSGLATSQRSLGLHFLWNGRSDIARPYFFEAYEISSSLNRQDPGNTDHQRQVAYSHLTIARLLLAEGDFESAVARLEVSVAEIEPRYRIQQDSVTRFYLGRTYLWLGIARARMGDSAGADTDWETARIILEPMLEESREPEFLVEWTRLMIQTEEYAQARTTAAELHNLKFARPDFMEMCHENNLLQN